MKVHDVYLERHKKKGRFKPVQVYQNPTARKISMVVQKSPYDSVRCLAGVHVDFDLENSEQYYTFEDFYIADADDILHEEMSEVAKNVDFLDDESSIEENLEQGWKKDNFIFVLNRIQREDMSEVQMNHWGVSEEEFWIARVFQGIPYPEEMYRIFREMSIMVNLKNMTNMPVYYQKTVTSDVEKLT